MLNETFCHCGQLVEVYKKISVNCGFIHFVFHDFLPALSPGANHPRGIEFLCQIKFFITMANWCKFHKNHFELLYTMFP